MKKITSYKAALYLRLSDEDYSASLKKDESNSIANQKALTLRELESLPDISLYDIYIDDGYTGLNYERPGFIRMLNDIYNNKVNTVIVKDLSRLGRDYIESGRYVKDIFPSLNIRFISVLDEFDSLSATPEDYNLLIPIKNFINDSYSRDISIKVRSTQRIMRENGLYIGAYVAYGYKKCSDDKNRIEPDEFSADIVKRIFRWKLEGMNAGAIADKLNLLGIIPPSEYKKMLGINYKSGFQKNVKAKWTPITITRILKNKIYIGIMEQGKRSKINYKLEKVVERPEYEWIVKEQTHTPIIRKEDFENVNRLLVLDTRKSPNEDKLYPLSGIIFCGECKKNMVRRKNNGASGRTVQYICSTYNKGQGCSRHGIGEKELENLLVDTINKHIREVADMNTLLQLIDNMDIHSEDILANDQELMQKHEELEKCQRMQTSLHKDLLEGIISQEEYEQFCNFYKEQYLRVENSISAMRDEIEKSLHKKAESRAWMDRFMELGNIEHLTRNVVVSLIDKVVLYEDKRIEIIFNYSDKYASIQRFLEQANASRTVEGV